jgi:hypothetical protein
LLDQLLVLAVSLQHIRNLLRSKLSLYCVKIGNFIANGRTLLEEANFL